SVPDDAPLASNVPLAPQATAVTGPGCSRVANSAPVSRDQRRTTASIPLLAIILPSGENSTWLTWLACRPAQRNAALAASHRLTAPSQLPLASSSPAGLQASAQTWSAWPRQARCNFKTGAPPPPPSSSHTLISPRRVAAANRLPSGSIASAVIASKVSV